VGKTTTAINIGAALKMLGKKILLIDMDPQGGVGIGLGVDPYSLNKSIYDVIVDNLDINKIIIETKSGLYIAPSIYRYYNLRKKHSLFYRDWTTYKSNRGRSSSSSKSNV